MVAISVIVCVFNGEEIVSAAINSIKNQTHQDWECIVCDDASEDATWEKLKELTRGDGRFALIRNDSNRGPAYARNRCIERARGDYIAIQDADDVSLPSRLERQIEFFSGHSNISAIGSYALLFDNNGNLWGEVRPPQFPKIKDWLKGSQVIHASVMIRKKDLDEVGLYDVTMRKAEDYDLLTRLVGHGCRVVTIPEFLYGIHADVLDYKRKNMSSRWQEAKVKQKVITRLGGPWYSFLYLLKPVMAGLIPSSMLYMHHKRLLKIKEGRPETIYDSLEQD